MNLKVKHKHYITVYIKHLTYTFYFYKTKQNMELQLINKMYKKNVYEPKIHAREINLNSEELFYISKNVRKITSVKAREF